MPMNTGIWYDILEAFELAHDKRTVCPGTGIGDLFSKRLAGRVKVGEGHKHRGGIGLSLGETRHLS